MNKRSEIEQIRDDKSVCRGVIAFSLAGIIAEIVRQDYFGAGIWIIPLCIFSYRTMTLVDETNEDTPKER